MLEGEEAIGFHSSGRSATMLHYALGDPLVRTLTLASRPFFDAPSDEFWDEPLGTRMPVLVHASGEELDRLDALHDAIAPFAAIDRLSAGAIVALCPVLKADCAIVDRNGLRLDPHALLQGHVRRIRARGGRRISDARVSRIDKAGGRWEVDTEKAGSFSADMLVNAAGA